MFIWAPHDKTPAGRRGSVDMTTDPFVNQPGAALDQLGYASLTEFSLANGQRADILALGKTGDLVIVEIKSSVADFRADRKWAGYRDFADRLYFAVPSDFPALLIPEECGLIVADPFGAALLRHGPAIPLAGARRRALTLRFARTAASRLRRHVLAIAPACPQHGGHGALYVLLRRLP